VRPCVERWRDLSPVYRSCLPNFLSRRGKRAMAIFPRKIETDASLRARRGGIEGVTDRRKIAMTFKPTEFSRRDETGPCLWPPVHSAAPEGG
jgi:hypothetical protein